MLLLAACHSAKPLPPLEAHGPPLAEPVALEALDGAGLRALWAESYGPLPMPKEPLRALQSLYQHDLLAGHPVEVSSARGQGKLPGLSSGVLTDGHGETYWVAQPGARGATLTVPLDGGCAGCLWLEEVPELGARVGTFAVDARVDGQWRQVAQGRGIGARKVVRFKPVVTQALRLRIQDGEDSPALRRMSAYAVPPLVRIMPDATDFLDETVIRMAADYPVGVRIAYTLDGSVPNAQSPVYDPNRPPKVAQTCRIRAVAFIGGDDSYQMYGLAPATAQVVAWNEKQLIAASPVVLPPEQGLAYACHENTPSLDKLASSEPAYAGLCADFSVKPRQAGSALVCEGWLKVETDGLYTFSLGGDARLWLDGQPVADSAGDARAKKIVAWRAGWHPLRVAWLADKAADLKCFGPGFPADGRIAPEKLGR